MTRLRGHGLAVGVAGASAVLLGAFGAHALQGVLTADSLSLWHTANGYHFWHALGMTAAALSAREGRRAWRLALWLFGAGLLLFCGSLYALALGAPHWAGAITPLGGLAFMIGWLALGSALGAVHRPPR
ncbi:MAG TPA: DUF423 domain-containing protein [Mizugakiibacter sp.]